MESYIMFIDEFSDRLFDFKEKVPETLSDREQ